MRHGKPAPEPQLLLQTMKYSKKQLRFMIKKLFAKVDEAMPWSSLEGDEVDQAVKQCRFALIENYTWSRALPSVDVLFLLAGEAKNYQAFIIKDGHLEELHQEHQAEYCTACMHNGSEQAEPLVMSNYF